MFFMHAFNKKLQYVASENCFSLAIVMFTDPSTQNHHIILTAVNVAKEAGFWLCIGQYPNIKIPGNSHRELGILGICMS